MRLRWVALASALLALMIYDGGVYPVPHTALGLLGLGGYRARVLRDRRPLIVACAIPAWAALLAAPKLLAVAETMARFPRLVSSNEIIDPLSWLRMFAWGGMPFTEASHLDYMWHEYGQYIGLLPLAVVVWGAPASRRRRPLRSARSGSPGSPFCCSRWEGSALGCSSTCCRSSSRSTCRADSRTRRSSSSPSSPPAPPRSRRLLPREVRGARAFDVGAWGAFALSAAFVAREDARCTRPWFSLPVPQVAERTTGYRQYDKIPPELSYGEPDPRSPRGVNDAPGLLVRRANVGSLRCSGFAGLNEKAPQGANGRALFLGARGIGDPLYRGEEWLEPDGPPPEIVRWTPNEVVLAARGGKAGDLLVLDQNWAPGWTANGGPRDREGQPRCLPSRR